MQGGYFSYGLLAALAIALLVAAFTDLKRRQIDNWLNAGIALGAPLFWLASGLSLGGIGYQLATAAGVFAVLLGLFALNAMGGGDVKLLTALALWIEPLWFLRLLFVMALVGGVLTVAIAIWHFFRRRRGTEARPYAKIAVPYGIAISIAGIWTIASQYLPAVRAGAILG